MSVNPKQLLKKYWGYEDFLFPQAQIIDSILHGHDTFAMLPTGGGKSITFQIPILMQSGLCLVVSPLIALMKDQIKNLRAKGIKAELISSELTKRQIEVILDNCRYGGVKILYVSPERIQSKNFQLAITNLEIQYVAIDEAHCISEWGHDFRPAYLALRTLKELIKDKPILALTATATPYIEKEIVQQLHLTEPNIFRTSLARKNLAYRVVRTEDKYQEIIDLLRQFPGASIVFCRTRKETFEVATYLSEQGLDADYYHARLSLEDKNRKQTNFIASDKMILCSTNAFGMGIDKPNIRNVFHLTAPDAIESYIQEVGRAGRDGELSRGFLLYNERDKKNAFKTFKMHLAKKEEFLNIIKKLYNYFQIGEHEQPTSQKAFSERKFRKQFDLHKQKTRNVLQFLKQQRIIDIQSTQQQSLVKINIPNTEIYGGKHPRAKVLSYLARHYGGIFQEPIAVDELVIARKLNLPYRTVKDSLKQLNEKDKIYYRDAAIVKIAFLEPRDDNEAKVRLYKTYVRLQKVKWTRLQSMHFLIEDDAICKSQLILKYFGESNPSKCGICNVCQPHLSNSILDSSSILQYLATGPKTQEEISKKFLKHDKSYLIKTLQELLDEGKITFELPNTYAI